MKYNFLTILTAYFAMMAHCNGEVHDEHGGELDETSAQIVALLEEHPELRAKYTSVDAFRNADFDSLPEYEQMFIDIFMPQNHSDGDGHRVLVQEDMGQHLRSLANVPSEAMTAHGKIKEGFNGPNVVATGSSFGGTERVKLQRSGSTCYITAQESNEIGDWVGSGSNLDLGNEGIRFSKIEKTCGRYSYCGCDRHWWGRCRRYKHCCRTQQVWKSEGYGYSGFVKPANAMRASYENKFKNVCKGAHTIVYAGYSRGGGIVQALAYGDKRAGMTNSGQNVRMVTFGSPRCLQRSEAFELEGFMDHSIRVVAKGSWGYDPVSSQPASYFADVRPWKWYEHVGRQRIPNIGHNAPTAFANYNFGLHFLYPNKF